MADELSIDEILEGMNIPPEHRELAKSLLAAQRDMREQLGREPNRAERRAFESNMRRAMRKNRH